MLEYELISKLLSHPIKLYKNSVTISHKLPEKANCQLIFCWPCISVQFVLITNLTHFFNVFISPLYVVRATRCSSSGESIVSIHHLVYIIVYVAIWYAGQGPAYQMATYTEW